MPYVFYNKPCVFLHIIFPPSEMPCTAFLEAQFFVIAWVLINKKGTSRHKKFLLLFLEVPSRFELL